MRSVAKGDLAGGLLTVAFGSAVIVHVRTFPQLPGGQPGPALFPGIIGALMIVFGLVLSMRSLAAGRSTAEASTQATDTTRVETPGEERGAEAGPAASTTRPRRTGIINATAVVAAVVAYILVAGFLGFVPTMVVLLALLMWRLDARPLVAIGASLITTAFITVVFRFVLLVPLPQGPFGI